jgi:predicted TIM-barrel fold metal-dependent hydrolase
MKPPALIDYSSKPPVQSLSIRAPHLANYDRIYGSRGPAVSEPAEDYSEAALQKYLASYEAVGASKVVIKARDLETTFSQKIRNEDVAAFCRTHGDRYIGFAGVDPHKGMTAVRELECAVRELGLRGLNLQCFEHKLAINDPKMYPLYAKCIELDIPVNIHCGINFSTSTTMEYGRPSLLDEVMVHFPELRVCAAPPGWPWVHELLGVAWKHPNLWIGLVYVRPKMLTVQHSGYEPLLQYGRTILQDKIIFGSGFPSLSLERALAEIDVLGLPDAVKAKWLGGNAATFMRLGQA